MLEILVVMAMVGIYVILAARRKRRSRGRLVYLPFDITHTLGTLSDNGIAAIAAQTLTQDFDIVGVRSRVTFSGATAGEGPIEAGWAQAELTGTQIVANRDASPTSQWDVLANEQSKRKVRVFGQSSGEANFALNDGEPVWRKMFLRIPSGKSLCDFWVINRTGAPLTTGQIVNMQGSVVGRWK